MLSYLLQVNILNYLLLVILISKQIQIQGYGYGLDIPANIEIEIECGVVTRKSNVINSIGVFATKDYKVGDIIEHCITVLVPKITVEDSILNDYRFKIYDVPNYTAIVLGYGSMYNHHDNENTKVVAQNRWCML